MCNMQMPVAQGWQCPICKRVYSPTTPMCYTCPGPNIVVTGNNTKCLCGTSVPCPMHNPDSGGRPL